MKNTKLKLILLLLLFFTGFNACKKESLISSNGTYSTVTLSKKGKLDLNGKAGLTLSDGQELKNFEDLDQYIKTYGLTDVVKEKYFYFDTDSFFRMSDWDDVNDQPIVATQYFGFYFKKILNEYLKYEDENKQYAAIIDPRLVVREDLYDHVHIYGTGPKKDPYADPFPFIGNPGKPYVPISNGGNPGATSGGGGGGGGPTPTVPKTSSKPKPSTKEYLIDRNGNIIAWREAGTKDWIALNQLDDVEIQAEKTKGNVFGMLVTDRIPAGLNLSGGNGSGEIITRDLNKVYAFGGKNGASDNGRLSCRSFSFTKISSTANSQEAAVSGLQFVVDWEKGIPARVYTFRTIYVNVGVKQKNGDIITPGKAAEIAADAANRAGASLTVKYYGNSAAASLMTSTVEREFIELMNITLQQDVAGYGAAKFAPSGKKTIVSPAVWNGPVTQIFNGLTGAGCGN